MFKKIALLSVLAIIAMALSACSTYAVVDMSTGETVAEVDPCAIDGISIPSCTTSTIQPTVIASATIQPTEQPRVILNPAIVCKYMDGYTSEGKTVGAGTQIIGPAVVKPNRDLDHALLIYTGVQYTTIASDETIWMLEGDNTCVDAQAQYFSSSEIIDR